MLGLGFAGGLLYLSTYLCLTSEWVSGSSYTFHSATIVSCVMLGISAVYSQAWPSVVINFMFIIMGAIYITRKVFANSRTVLESSGDCDEKLYQVGSDDSEAAAKSIFISV
jgi:hypothetical protein